MLPAGSDPWLGSVNPKHPTISPFANLGKYFSFCSSVPKLKTDSIEKIQLTGYLV
jgi:hypothetical protein